MAVVTATFQKCGSFKVGWLWIISGCVKAAVSTLSSREEVSKKASNSRDNCDKKNLVAVKGRRFFLEWQ